VPTLSLDEAHRATEAGKRKAEQMNVKVSIATVNERGDVILLERMDGAGHLTPKIALGKAAAIAFLKRPWQDLEQRVRDNPVFYSGISVATHGGVLFGRGGVLVVKENQVVGGVGVSGAKSDEDEAIASEAVKAIG